MDLRAFLEFDPGFGLIEADCETVVECFVGWQNLILAKWEMFVEGRQCADGFPAAVQSLRPRASPVTTKFLFWSVGRNWTIYLDNGGAQTNASGVMQELSRRMGVISMRCLVAAELKNVETKQIAQYPAVILEVFKSGAELRHIFAAKDGAAWRFGQAGAPFSFESQESYSHRKIADRFTEVMLFDYLAGLGVPVDGGNDRDIGFVVEKGGRLPKKP